MNMNMWDGKIDIDRDTLVFQLVLYLYVQSQNRIIPKDLNHMPPKASLEVKVIDATDENYPDKNTRDLPEGFLELDCVIGLSGKKLADILAILLQQKAVSNVNVLKCQKLGFDLKILETKEFDSDSFSSVHGMSFLSNEDIEDSAQLFFEIKVNQTALKAYLGKYLELWKNNQFNDYNLNILDSEQQIQIIKDQIVGLSNKTASDTQVLSSPEIGNDSFLDLFATAWYLEVNGVIQIIGIISEDSLRIRHIVKDADLSTMKFETDDDYGYLKIPDQEVFRIKKDTNQFELLNYLYTKVPVGKKVEWQECYTRIHEVQEPKDTHNNARSILDVVNQVNRKSKQLWNQKILSYENKEVMRLA